MADAPTKSAAEDAMVKGLALAYRAIPMGDIDVNGTIEQPAVHDLAQLANHLHVGDNLPPFVKAVVAEQCGEYESATPLQRYLFDKKLNDAATEALGAMRHPPSEAEIAAKLHGAEEKAQAVPFEKRTAAQHALAEESPLIDHLAARGAQAVNDPRLAATREALPSKVTGLNGADACLALAPSHSGPFDFNFLPGFGAPGSGYSTRPHEIPPLDALPPKGFFPPNDHPGHAEPTEPKAPSFPPAGSRPSGKDSRVL